MSKTIVKVMCVTAVLAYGYLSYLPKRYIERSSASIIDCAATMQDFEILRYYDAEIGSPQLQLSNSKWNELVYSIPVRTVDAGVPDFLIYVTLEPELNIGLGEHRVGLDWNTVSISAEMKEAK